MKMSSISIINLAKKIINVLFLTFLLISIYFIFSSKVFGTTPQMAGFQFVTILTGSMEPSINPGSLIVIKKINDPANLKLNDVITFQSPRFKNVLITHRIVEIKKLNAEIYYSTKGDSNSTTDAKRITGDDILGEYQDISIPYLGYLLEFTKTKWGFFIFFLIPVFLLLIPNLRYLQSLYTRKRLLGTGGVIHENHKLD